MSAHERWRVYRGDSSEESDLIFSVKRSSMVQLRAKLQVFLANNKNEDVCDFKVEADFSAKSCEVSAGQSSSKVAKVSRTFSLSLSLSLSLFFSSINWT
jgi:hypothetical protein